MPRFVLAASAVVAVWASVGSALGTPYWIEWTGDDGNWPEAVGYERIWGNWQGQYQGPGAFRTLENGILTYDSLYDDGVYDFYDMVRPGQMDPQAGDGPFLLEWGVEVDQVVGTSDPEVFVSSDDAWVLGLTLGMDRIYSVFEDFVEIPFTPGVFHTFRVVSPAMRAYELYVDDELVRLGSFQANVGPSEIAWGDGCQGAASLHRWSYVRFGVVPAPPAMALLAILSASCKRALRK